MNRCDRKVDIGRRWFLSGAGVAAAGAAAATVIPQRAEASPQLARVAYPSNRLANVSDLKPNAPSQVTYPDPDAPGRADQARQQRSRAASGPTATSSASRPICPHKGFPLSYNA